MGSELTANQLLALFGGIIVAGFLANLAFKIFKIPSVVKLMILGLILGPILKLPADQLLDIAPYFGQVALLIILFAGGMRLRIETVIAQLGNAILLAVLAFTATLLVCIPISYYVMGFGMLQTIIFSTLMAGTASSIVIPVVTKLSIKESLKTLLSIESAISNLLILVVVIVACEIHLSEPNIWSILYTFFLKIFVSLASAVVAGIIWSRLIGSMRGEPYSYMLTLGFIFLLNFIVDLMGGSGAISILFFGIVLANVARILGIAGPRLNSMLGVKVDATKFSLDEFVKGISGELSFLVATFFFVFLGMLVDLEALASPEVIKNISLLMVGIIVARVLMVQLFSRLNKARFTVAETIILIAMMPRGLATAVMAFKPAEAPYNIEGTELFPFYAMFAILGTNIIMAIIVKTGESWLKRELRNGAAVVESISSAVAESVEDAILTTSSITKVEELKPIELLPEIDGELTPELEPAVESGEEPEQITGFNRLLFKSLGIGPDSFIPYVNKSIYSLFLRDSVYLMKIVIVMVISVLGLMMNKPEVVLAAMLLFPMMELINTMAISIVTGDVYIFLRANLKIVISFFTIVLLTFLISAVAPFTGITDEIRAQTEPTVLNFILSLASGAIIPIMLIRGKKLEILAITPILGILIVPPLSTIGFSLGTGITNNFLSPVFLGGLLSFATNYSCIIIGAVLSQFILGISYESSPKAVKIIEKWHEKEVERDDLHSWFERLRLTRLFETVGTPIARVIVIGVLMLLIYIPLQLAVNDIQKDYKFKEAMNAMSKEYFEIADQSSVISQTAEYHKDKITVKIWVTTAKKFPKKISKQFENELEATMGIPVTFSLVQSFTHFGEDAEFTTLAEAVPIETFSLNDQFNGLKEKLQDVFVALPQLSEIVFMDIYAGISHVTEVPVISVEVFSKERVSRDMHALLKEKIAEELEVDKFEFRIVQQPKTFVINDFESVILEKNNEFIKAAELADHLPELTGILIYPKDYEEKEFKTLMQSLHPALGDSTRFRVRRGTDKTMFIEFD